MASPDSLELERAVDGKQAATHRLQNFGDASRQSDHKFHLELNLNEQQISSTANKAMASIALLAVAIYGLKGGKLATMAAEFIPTAEEAGLATYSNRGMARSNLRLYNKIGKSLWTGYTKPLDKIPDLFERAAKFQTPIHVPLDKS